MIIILYSPTGTLSLSLQGYSNIPTDGSGRILITDIREDVAEQTLACNSDVASGSSNWYYHPSSMTTASSARILTDDIPRGYVIRRDPSFPQRIYLRRNLDVSASLEGLFTCEILNDSPISIRIYYLS